MPKARKNIDAIRLDRKELLLLFFVLVAAAVFIWKRLPEEDRVEAPRKRIDIDIRKEREPGVEPYRVLSRQSSPPGSADGATWDIAVPCVIERDPLIATLREVLLTMYISHPDDLCHHVRVYLDGMNSAAFSPVTEGHLCKAGRVVDGKRTAPWDFHIRLVSKPRRADLDLEEDDSLYKLCGALAGIDYCPWDHQEPDESKGVAQIAEQLRIPQDEARNVIRLGKNLVSDNFYYRQELR